MAVKRPNFVYSVFVLLILCGTRLSLAIYSIEYQTVSDCKTGETDLFHQFFDYSQLQCTNCFQNRTLQTVSVDGLSCVCQSGYYLTENFGGAKVTCAKCATGRVSAENPWECVECQTVASPPINTCPACDAATQVPVERLLNGAWQTSNNPSRTCDTCVAQTYPNTEQTQCVRCNQILTVLPGANNCECPPSQFTGGMCFESPEDINFQGSNLYTVNFEGVGEIESAYFDTNLRAAGGMCRKYQNVTACQHLANLCTLYGYNQDNFNRLFEFDACSLYNSIGRSQGFGGRGIMDWPPNMPWLYYLDETAEQVLTDTGLSTVFTFPNTELPLRVAKYTLNGTFLGYTPVTDGTIQLCPNQASILNAAWRFGTQYSQSCEVPLSTFWDTEATPLYFYDLWMEFGEGNSELYAIPVLITNYLDSNGDLVNEQSDQTNWQLVRRFFLVDNVSGKPVATSSGTTTTEQTVQAVHYAESMILHVTLQTDNSGKIYPPYLEITYGVASYEDFQNGKNVQVSFKVEYEMNQSKQQTDVSIAVGVIAALAIVYAGFQSWVWNRRAGKISIDFFTLSKFFLFGCNNLANAFFVVIFGYSVWMLIFYKRQSTVTLIPPDNSQISQFVGFIVSAFLLKLIALIHLLYVQCKVDIFFIDWERPHGKITTSNDAAQQGKEAPVSIWRTYFVANEWNEIQSCRKINNIFQIFGVIFFLQVVGFGNMATQEPRTSLNPGPDAYVSPYNKIFRFAAGALVYLIVAVVQWLFYVLIYERFSADKLKNYVDLCSMSNVSVFILENDQFGYYIHGRSPHGQADTGLRQMAENLKREENSLCAERGLVPNTDQQTFQILVQQQLRTQYDKVIKPITQPAQGAAGAVRGQGPGGKPSDLSDHQEKSIAAYGMLNKFLQNFIDHTQLEFKHGGHLLSLRNIDYVIKDKVLFENILNAEFQDIKESGVFYNDGGKSFGAILFMGNETTLTIFEILFFSVMDLATGNYVLAAILVYILMEFVTLLRDSLGELNLAQKTLVDKRFLI